MTLVKEEQVIKTDTALLTQLSKRAGERMDLVQAGGGNTSIKNEDGTMIIKASGCRLSEVSEKSGFVRLDNQKVLRMLEAMTGKSFESAAEKDAWSSREVASFCLSEGRPSMETTLHAVTGKITLHTHPVTVNEWAARPDWETLFSDLFPEAVLVSYKTPGVALTEGILDAAAKADVDLKSGLQTIILQNHGLIVTGDTVEEVLAHTDNVVDLIAEKQGRDMAADVAANTVSRWFEKAGQSDGVSYLCRDESLADFRENPASFVAFAPDIMIYCGYEIVNLDENPVEALKGYFETFKKWPKTVMFNENLYLIGPSIKKCREAEEVLLFTADCIRQSSVPLQSLSKDECFYLVNWEAEKFRENV